MLVQYLTHEVRTTERLLLQLAYVRRAEQRDVDTLVATCTADDLRPSEALLLDAIVRRQPDIALPAAVVTHIEGVKRRLLHRTAELGAGFADLGRALNEQRIDILLLKGAAARCINPKEVRQMNDIDLLVRENDYERAVQIAFDQGFTHIAGAISAHSIDLERRGCYVDIHFRIFGLMRARSTDLAEAMMARAMHGTFAGVEVLLPAPEDRMLLALINSYCNLFLNPEQTAERFAHFVEEGRLADIPRIIADSKALAWDKVMQRACETGFVWRVRMMLRVVNWLMPGLLPAAVVAEVCEDSKTMRQTVRRAIVQREKMHCYTLRKQFRVRSLCTFLQRIWLEMRYLRLYILRKMS